jgi:thiamine biosynthesis protein ThiC
LDLPVHYFSTGLRTLPQSKCAKYILRYPLDWKGQIKASLDPARAQALRDSRTPAEDDVCTMCGEFCAIKILNKEKTWDFGDE